MKLISYGRGRKRQTNIKLESPYFTTMFRIALASGCNLHLAVIYISQSCDGILSKQLKYTARQIQQGERVGYALEQFVEDTSLHINPLISTLLSSERYGAPVASVLEQLARDAHSDQMHLAEQRARRLSVQLLFPLAGLTLPAFILLAVVPIVVSALQSLTIVS